MDKYPNGRFEIFTKRYLCRFARRILKRSYLKLYGRNKDWLSLDNNYKSLRYFFTSGFVKIDGLMLKVPDDVFDRNLWVFVKLIFTTPKFSSLAANRS